MREKRKRLQLIKIIGIVVCISMGLLATVTKSYAANARVMVSDYKIKEESVISGKEFFMTITLKNTAKRNVKNLKLTICSENGELLPVKGAGTAYIDQLDAESEQELSFSMKAAEGLEEKSYKLLLKTEYEDTSGMSYTVEETIFLPVSLERRVSVTDIYMAEDMVDLGSSLEVTGMVNNLGDGTLYNVTAKITGDNVQEQESYIGNVESGKSGTIDVVTKALHISQNEQKNQIEISYEDREGNTFQESFEIEISVVEPAYENLEKIKGEDKKSGISAKKVIVIVCILAVIAGIAVAWIKKRRRKKKILEEF